MIFRGIRRSDRPFCDPAGARTLDPLIKSQLLYQLSYGVLHCQGVFPLMRCKVRKFFWSLQIFLRFFCFNLNVRCYFVPSVVIAPVVGSRRRYAGAFLSVNRRGSSPNVTPSCAMAILRSAMVRSRKSIVIRAFPGMLYATPPLGNFF